jgi:methyl-accepting chemotaxis protein
MLTRLSIQAKLILFGIIMLIPIALLGKLFVEQSAKDIDFAARERIGVSYLQAVWPLLGQITKADIAPPPAQMLTELGKADRLYGNIFGTKSQYQGTVSAAKQVGKSDDPQAASRAYTLSVTQLIAHVGDKSNLILDPDLDSYYAMDVVVLRLPELLVGMKEMQDAAAAYRDKPSHFQIIALGSAIKAFNLRSDAVLAAANNAMNNNASGQTRKSLLAANQNFAASQAKMADLMSALSQPNADATAIVSEMAAAETQMHAASNALWQATAKELDRLLQVRIQGFDARRNGELKLISIVLLAACLIGFFISRAMTSSLGKIVTVMSRLRSGDTDVVVPFSTLKTEIGEVARALDVFKEAIAIAKNAKSELEQTVAAVQDENTRLNQSAHQQLLDMAEILEGQVGTIVDMLGITSEQLDSASKSLTEASQAATDEIRVAADLVTTTESSMTAIRPGTQQLAASIAQVASEISHATNATNMAASRSHVANERIAALMGAAERVGSIVGIIDEIASQTQLLALNATIEAARAGDAGRGFAVVASEVKLLANQTAKFTGDITAQINEIQTATQFASDHITDMGKMITGISTTSTTISAAIEEQTASTSDISRSIDDIAAQSERAASSVSKAETAMVTASHSASEVAMASEHVRMQSDILRRDFAKFLAQLRKEDAVAA